MVQICTFRIEGLSPLLMNNPACMESNENKKPTTRTKKIDPTKDAEIRRYVNENGNMYFPSQGFLNSLWEGSAYQKIGKDTARKNIQMAVFITEPDTILMENRTGKPITKSNYRIDSRWVVIKGNRIMRHRPFVEDWHCLLSLEIDDDIISADIIVSLFNLAGKRIGIGDLRPAKRGSFGRYKAGLYDGSGKSMAD